MNEYKLLFEQIKRQEPQVYEILLKRYIDKIERLREERNKVFIVSVLNDFRENEMHAEFPDIYEKYGDSHFLTRKLDAQDIDYILKRYQEGIMKMYEEVCHV